MSEISPVPLRRNEAVNYGNRATIRGAQREGVISLSLDESSPVTVYVAVKVEVPTTVPLATVVPTATLEWGHGGASLRETLPVFGRLRVPLVASTVQVEVALRTVQGPPPPNNVVGEFTVVVAHGADGQTLHLTSWRAQSGAEGLVATGPQRLVRVEGYNAAALLPRRWLMLFDAGSRPQQGTTPVVATPIPAMRPFSVRRQNGRGFLAGVFWAVSRDPLVLDFDPAARLRVETELFA